ncbi:glycosyltransferase [Mongoliitalea lutea]|uniref:Glycosyl transferase family 1 domain-containing protein n=1 Tax=Mongoliitalea lutea TaxID=849756 RepID=A0A8J3G400_9BACT|nr:glycosyltransferase [Mongoliitalea lutea]GHB23784.1 hypothetical protein GCM10008106_00470 [Mongoliitalea lutea]
MKDKNRISIFYRGPLERSRLGFLLELFATTGKRVRLIWLLPHPKFQNENNRVLEPFMESYPEIEYQVISAKFTEVFSTRSKVLKLMKQENNGVTVCIGFTAPYFLPGSKSGVHIWCINGIPEESLLHRNTFSKRLEVSLKWKLLGMLYTPNLVITVSDRMSRYVSEKVSCPNFFAIPLCVDLDRFSTKNRIERKYFTYSGSGAPWQNLTQLSEIWVELFKLDSSLKFRVISRDARAKILGKYLPVEAIEFVGTSDLDELASLMDQAEAGFLIRKDSLVNRVSFPTKLSEYLASGAWAVVSDIDWDVSKYIKKNQVGVLVNPQAASSLIAKEILEARRRFKQDEGIDQRLKNTVVELGKKHWLKVGNGILMDSGYFI